MASPRSTNSTLPLGRHLSQGQLRQLQWIVPKAWSKELLTALATWPLAGARVRALLEQGEHWIGFFDGPRLVEEALRPAAYHLLSERGLLPIAGCGRRGASVYLVDVTSPGLEVWLVADGSPARSLGTGLAQLWTQCEPEPRASLRRRLPEKTPRRLAKTSGHPSRTATAPVAACSRTLPLFA